MKVVWIILLGLMVDFNVRVGDSAVLWDMPDFIMGEKKVLVATVIPSFPCTS